jgi:hypothetical protein
LAGVRSEMAVFAHSEARQQVARLFRHGDPSGTEAIRG